MARPLYLDHPGARQAYTHPEEYQFGPSLLVAPIVSRGMGKNWLSAARRMVSQGPMVESADQCERSPDPETGLSWQLPMRFRFIVRGGVPLPMQPVKMRTAQKPTNPLVVRVYPGPSGRFTLYEDDGTSPAYLHGAYALTPLRI